MSSREQQLQSIWQQHLVKMPREKVDQVMKQFGLSKSMTKKLDDESARKAVFGILAKLDDQTLAGVSPFLSSI
ncbi:hypothetical protein LSG31_22435 [Fodinisporobacter ferrooxydans]|uniref:Uncharacterized protein n=1 Tax=Fodinisporobacter ferrooxydans TaxID=2901836 RepID=A0ABY4CMC4_9BACL|nr:hypothetical protein LSG31_22435 [Alicyclobacillaceae bacterium MYW30-H2]